MLGKRAAQTHTNLQAIPVSEKYLHIITHDVPYPADFGGVIDAFHKIKALHKIGIKIILHCFTKKRPEQIILENYCESVTYYPRKFIGGISLKLPFIIASRRDKQLLHNLQKDNHPILFDGVHTTYWLHKNKLNNRKVFLRILNVEYIYYSFLAKNETNFLKKWHYSFEANLLKKYELGIANKATLLALSETDETIFKHQMQAKKVIFLPAFLPDNIVETKVGKGKYCLYQGNLSVNENEKAAIWLIENVFSMLDKPLVIAGFKPSTFLINLSKRYKNISIVASPSEINMKLLIANAQINILPSFNQTGVKFKLLHSLYNGRYCLVNNAGVEGSALNELCFIKETEVDFKTSINHLFTKNFTTKEMQHRSAALNKLYNNEQNAQVINEILQ